MFTDLGESFVDRDLLHPGDLRTVITEEFVLRADPEDSRGESRPPGTVVLVEGFLALLADLRGGKVSHDVWHCLRDVQGMVSSFSVPHI